MRRHPPIGATAAWLIDEWALEGAGKVGRHLIELLLDAGARVVVSDLDPNVLLDFARDERVEIVKDVIPERLDVYAPCALGGSLTPTSVEALNAKVVCGAANNQLQHRGVAELLRIQSIQWVPDFVANAGGLIQVGSELLNSPADLVRQKVLQIEQTTRELLHLAVDHDITKWEAARRLANARLEAGRTSPTRAV